MGENTPFVLINQAVYENSDQTVWRFHMIYTKVKATISRGRTYAKKLFFTQKKSRLRKSENAVRLLYAKNSDLTHQNAFSLFVFLHPAEKVCRALAVGLNILDFPRPLPSPSHPGEGMLVPALRYS